MFKKTTFFICGVLILALSVLSTNAHSIPFDGDVWLAHHINTPDYFLLFDTETDINKETVKLNGLKIKMSSQKIDFSELIAPPKDKPPLFFEIVDYRNKNNIKAIFEDINGNKYQVAAKIKEFHNPPLSDPISIPEPGMILLLGSSLICLAVIGRQKKSP